MRIAGLSDRGAPLWFKLLGFLQKRKFREVLLPTRLWALAPQPFRGFTDFFLATDRDSSPLEPSLRSLVMVRVSQVNSCSYCIDINAAALLERGITLEKALALEDHQRSPLFSARERLVLDYAVQMTRDSRVAAETFADVRAELGEPGVVELTALVAMQNASSKFNGALELGSQGFCPAMPGPSLR